MAKTFGASDGPKSDYVGYFIGALVFAGMGLMKGMNEPSKQEPLAPGLHTAAAAEQGERIRVIARVASVDGGSVKLEDGPVGATATMPEERARSLKIGQHSLFVCKVAQPGQDLKLECEG